MAIAIIYDCILGRQNKYQKTKKNVALRLIPARRQTNRNKYLGLVKQKHRTSFNMDKLTNILRYSIYRPRISAK